MSEEFEKFEYGTRVRVKGFHRKGPFEAIVMNSLAAFEGTDDEIKSSMYQVMELAEMPEGGHDHGDKGVDYHYWVPSQLMEAINLDLEYNCDLLVAFFAVLQPKA